MYRIISLAVIALIVVTLIIPTIDGLQVKHVVEQEADESYHMLSSSEVASSSYNMGLMNEGVMINQVYISLRGANYLPIAVSDTFMIVFESFDDHSYFKIQGTIDEFDEMEVYGEINLSNGVLSVDLYQATILYHELCILSEDGTYGLFPGSFNINPESKVFVVASAAFDSSYYWCTLFGEFDSLVGVALTNSGTVDVEAVLDLSDNHNGSLRFSSYNIEITSTHSGATHTGTGHIETILAPKSYYYYEKSSQSIIWGIIPLLLLIVPIVYAARMITDRRD